MKSVHTKLALVAVFVLVGPVTAGADESDQYLVWDRELADSGPAINQFINQKARAEIAAENAAPGPPCDCETLALRIIPEIYLHRLRANIVDLVEKSQTIDTYPAHEIENGDILALSIYRRAPVKAVIRVTRTLRVGDVYFGVDKLNHLVGIGRRYYVRYLADRALDIGESQAVHNAIEWGISTENSILGRRINGIVSPADLEANYQGLQFARRFCEGDRRYLRFDGQRWFLAQEVDIAEFITPAFDETFYPPLYDDDLRMAVLSVVAEEYAGRAQSPIVIARFERYRRMKPSPSMREVEAFLRGSGITTQAPGLMEVLGVKPGDVAAPIDPFNLDASLQNERP